MTLDEMERIAREAAERAEKATPGPWLWDDNFKSVSDFTGDELATEIFEKEDGDFIAAARSDVPALAAAVLELVQRVRELERRDADAAEHVESVIAMRTAFTGEPPYVGWRGLGLAITEALDERDQLRERVCELEEEGWQPIETAPKDRIVLVFAPGDDPGFCETLPDLICTCRWHHDAGFCVDELRVPMYWRPLPASPKEEA